MSQYSWDAASNLVVEQVSDGGPSRCGEDGYATSPSVNAVNEVTSAVKDWTASAAIEAPDPRMMRVTAAPSGP